MVASGRRQSLFDSAYSSTTPNPQKRNVMIGAGENGYGNLLPGGVGLYTAVPRGGVSSLRYGNFGPAARFKGGSLLRIAAGRDRPGPCPRGRFQTPLAGTKSPALKELPKKDATCVRRSEANSERDCQPLAGYFDYFFGSGEMSLSLPVRRTPPKRTACQCRPPPHLFGRNPDCSIVVSPGERHTHSWYLLCMVSAVYGICCVWYLLCMVSAVYGICCVWYLLCMVSAMYGANETQPYSTAICYSCAIIIIDGSTWGWLGGSWDGARPAASGRALLQEKWLLQAYSSGNAGTETRSAKGQRLRGGQVHPVQAGPPKLQPRTPRSCEVGHAVCKSGIGVHSGCGYSKPPQGPGGGVKEESMGDGGGGGGKTTAIYYYNGRNVSAVYGICCVWLEWGGGRTAFPRDKNFLRGGGFSLGRLVLCYAPAHSPGHGHFVTWPQPFRHPATGQFFPSPGAHRRRGGTHFLESTSIARTPPLCRKEEVNTLCPGVTRAIFAGVVATTPLEKSVVSVLPASRSGYLEPGQGKLDNCGAAGAAPGEIWGIAAPQAPP
eukprot:gene23553-biopygen14880